MPRISPIHWKVLEKIFLAAGFKFARQEGSHRAYVKKGILRPVIIPTYSEVPVTIIRNNLKQRVYRGKSIFNYWTEHNTHYLVIVSFLHFSSASAVSFSMSTGVDTSSDVRAHNPVLKGPRSCPYRVFLAGHPVGFQIHFFPLPKRGLRLTLIKKDQESTADLTSA